ncbi:MAG: metallophosphoesterase [Candidatus Tectomicrobia bacterium]|nr:metallophosphoesterase [Candidatus Tectomicrobia bacterium]
MTRETLLLKRQQIERGELQGWARRGRSYHAQSRRFRDRLLRQGLQLLSLSSWAEANVRQFVVKPLHFSFDTLPEAFDGFTILHLSDLHADGLEGLADDLYDRIQDLEVDLCVLTGDYRFKTTGDCQQVYTSMARILSGVNARHGIAGVLGNHDSFEMISELERLGVKMLLNESHGIQQNSQSIWLAGVDDPHYYGCEDLPVALSEVSADAFKILLVHSPEMYADADAHGIHLYLCGHTHGGQICLPLWGPIVTNANCPRRYTRGRWRHRNMQGYTSSGTGASGVPVRFFCPPEIGLITLHRTATSTPQTRQYEDQQQLIPSAKVGANRISPS